MIARMLRPSDVLKPDVDEQAKAKELEATIDEALRRYDRHPVSVKLHTTSRIAELVAANYRANDWLVDVKAEPVPRGHAQVFVLTFTIASPPRSGPGR